MNKNKMKINLSLIGAPTPVLTKIIDKNSSADKNLKQIIEETIEENLEGQNSEVAKELKSEIRGRPYSAKIKTKENSKVYYYPISIEDPIKKSLSKYSENNQLNLVVHGFHVLG